MNSRANVIERRDVLQTIAGGTATLSGVGSVSAAPPELDGRVLGATYDTLTQKTGTTVRGRVRRTDTGLDGRVNVAGFSIPLTELETEIAPADRPFTAIHTAELDGPEFTRTVDGKSVPLRVTVFEHSDNLSGTIRRPTTEFGQLGFFAFNETEVSPEGVLQQHSMDEKWRQIEREAGVTFDIPGTGIPRDSSLQRLRTLGGDS